MSFKHLAIVFPKPRKAVVQIVAALRSNVNIVCVKNAPTGTIYTVKRWVVLHCPHDRLPMSWRTGPQIMQYCLALAAGQLVAAAAVVSQQRLKIVQTRLDLSSIPLSNKRPAGQFPSTSISLICWAHATRLFFIASAFILPVCPWWHQVNSAC